MTPEENVAYLEKVLERAKQGAPAAATAMARHVATRASKVTLRRSSHSPGEWYRQRPGEPPGFASGNLAESMFYKPAYQGVRTSAMVGNSADYSRILEFGCVITPVNRRFMHWTDSGGSWYHKMLVVPPHPYLSTTTEDAIRDHELQDAAIDAFRDYDP